jgi:hypothetical protein
MCYILSIEQQVLRPSFPFDRSSKKKKKVVLGKDQWKEKRLQKCF